MPSLLVANLGSTSFKFRLYDMPSEAVLATGGAERIGDYQSRFRWDFGGKGSGEEQVSFPDHEAAIRHTEAKLVGSGLPGCGDCEAIGFKPVMARGFSGTRHFTGEVLAGMEALYTLFPAHNPPYVNAVRTMQRLFPQVPCIGTFETAFYDHVPVENRRFPIPLEWEEKYGIRREGFHGASHRYVTERAAALLERPEARLISCHLGGSSSIAAIRAGRAVDSSWGMTAQSGLPQNNRVGDFDVFAAFHLLADHGLSLDEVRDSLSTRSGLKGMSGLPTGDIRDLLEAEAHGHENARIALAVFVSQIRKFIGQFLVSLNGADAILFTAGIAENNPVLRSRICANLDFCGLQLDEEINRSVRATEARISSPDSRIEVWVIPTNEEIIIARNAWALLHPDQPGD